MSDLDQKILGKGLLKGQDEKRRKTKTKKKCQKKMTP